MLRHQTCFIVFDNVEFAIDCLLMQIPALNTHLLLFVMDFIFVINPVLDRCSARTIAPSSMSKTFSEFMTQHGYVNPWRFNQLENIHYFPTCTIHFCWWFSTTKGQKLWIYTHCHFRSCSLGPWYNPVLTPYKPPPLETLPFNSIRSSLLQTNFYVHWKCLDYKQDR